MYKILIITLLIAISNFSYAQNYVGWSKTDFKTDIAQNQDMVLIKESIDQERNTHTFAYESKKDGTSNLYTFDNVSQLCISAVFVYYDFTKRDLMIQVLDKNYQRIGNENGDMKWLDTRNNNVYYLTPLKTSNGYTTFSVMIFKKYSN